VSFPFVQFEFAFPLGPADGRYLRRIEPGDEPERVLVLRTIGAPPRPPRRRRRPRRTQHADAAPVPTVRATVIRPTAFPSAADAESWLERLRRDDEARGREVADATVELNFMLYAHRAAAADPHARDVAADAATVVRIGYGSGELVADGRYDAAFEVPPQRRKRRRGEVLAPQERLAATLAAREPLVPAEELVLRARADADARRPREAALQARIALEALLAQLGPEADAAALQSHRQAVVDAAGAALDGDPGPQLSAAVNDAIAAMERAVRHATVARRR
jgi:hypothetical protein